MNFETASLPSHRNLKNGWKSLKTGHTAGMKKKNFQPPQN
jgi:hypothetical protein